MYIYMYIFFFFVFAGAFCHMVARDPNARARQERPTSFRISIERLEHGQVQACTVSGAKASHGWLYLPTQQGS